MLAGSFNGFADSGLSENGLAVAPVSGLGLPAEGSAGIGLPRSSTDAPSCSLVGEVPHAASAATNNALNMTIHSLFIAWLLVSITAWAADPTPARARHRHPRSAAASPCHR